jgi:hypothetical protein
MKGIILAEGLRTNFLSLNKQMIYYPRWGSDVC